MRGFNCINLCTGILLVSIVATVSSRAIHEEMTMNELARTFDRTENLPEYELLPIRYTHVNKRDINEPVSLELKPFGDHIKLWLEPVDGVLFSDETPILSATGSPQGIRYERWSNVMKLLAPLLYRNYETYTTLAVNRGANRSRRMVGVIGSKNLVIRPVPLRLVANVTRHRRSVDNIPESEHDDHHYHIVYKSATTHAIEPFKTSLRMKRSNQDTVYPEILVVVDDNLYRIFKDSWEDILMYFVAFWNGVDMRFRAIENPKYRLHIRAIIFAENESVLDYVSLNKVGGDKLNFEQALNGSQYWLFNRLPLSIDVDSYDVAVTMTSLALCDPAGKQGKCELGTLGVAYVSQTCKIIKRLGMVSKTAIIHDNGGFNGISTAAHELGHSFGAHHDGERSNVRCADKNGNIMAAHTSKTENLADWSDCSLVEFGTFLETKGDCLYNKPKFGVNLVRLLPGRMMDADKQCESMTGKKAAKHDETVCQKLWCISKDDPHVATTTGPAVDGTPCGDEGLCIHGRCILESMVTY